MDMLELTHRSGEKVYIRMDQISKLYKVGDVTVIHLIHGKPTEVIESVKSIINVLKDFCAIYTV